MEIKHWTDSLIPKGRLAGSVAREKLRKQADFQFLGIEAYASRYTAAYSSLLHWNTLWTPTRMVSMLDLLVKLLFVLTDD